MGYILYFILLHYLRGKGEKQMKVTRSPVISSSNPNHLGYVSIRKAKPLSTFGFWVIIQRQLEDTALPPYFSGQQQNQVHHLLACAFWQIHSSIIPDANYSVVLLLAEEEMLISLSTPDFNQCSNDNVVRWFDLILLIYLFFYQQCTVWINKCTYWSLYSLPVLLQNRLSVRTIRSYFGSNLCNLKTLT